MGYKNSGLIKTALTTEKDDFLYFSARNSSIKDYCTKIKEDLTIITYLYDNENNETSVFRVKTSAIIEKTWHESGTILMLVVDKSLM